MCVCQDHDHVHDRDLAVFGLGGLSESVDRRVARWLDADVAPLDVIGNGLPEGEAD